MQNQIGKFDKFTSEYDVSLFLFKCVLCNMEVASKMLIFTNIYIKFSNICFSDSIWLQSCIPVCLYFLISPPSLQTSVFPT